MVYAIAALSMLCNLDHTSKLRHVVSHIQRLSQLYMKVRHCTLWLYVTWLVLLLMGKPAGLVLVAVCGYLRAAFNQIFIAKQLEQRLKRLQRSVCRVGFPHTNQSEEVHDVKPLYDCKS